MQGLGTYACALGGSLAGMLLWVQALRWAVLIHTTASSKHQLAWFTPVVALLHPAPWMLAGLAYLVYRVSTRAVAPGWSWLVGGIAAGLLMQALVLARAWPRIRASQATKPPQAP